MLLVDGAPTASPGAEAAQRPLEILLRELPLKQAVKLAAELAGGRRNELYRMALEMKRGSER